MASLRELALLAERVYDTPTTSVDGWTCVNALSAAGPIMGGLQAATFTKNGETVIAFRGTAAGQDVLADVKLGCGMNSTYFAAAESYVANYTDLERTTLCGHSLGGAITQIVANRRGYKFATFNAPGVAVFASRNVGSLFGPLTGVRIAGSLASVVRHPMQAWSDVRSTFNRVTGVNVCLGADVVSQIGVHYGNVIRVPGPTYNPLTAHGIGTVREVLASNAIGALGVAELG
jgi:hypothetical protein